MKAAPSPAPGRTPTRQAPWGHWLQPQPIRRSAGASGPRGKRVPPAPRGEGISSRAKAHVSFRHLPPPPPGPPPGAPASSGLLALPFQQSDPGFPHGTAVKSSPSLSREDHLEKGMTAYSSILAWRIPWTREPGGLPPGSQASSRGEAKDSALLSSRDAGLLEPPERPQGSPASSSVWIQSIGQQRVGHD